MEEEIFIELTKEKYLVLTAKLNFIQLMLVTTYMDVHYFRICRDHYKLEGIRDILQEILPCTCCRSLNRYNFSFPFKLIIIDDRKLYSLIRQA